ncbi:MAG: hypothetical protein PUE01_10675, partial [Clostridiaceae bacterium]|nr:hypothetical protein [Clostridiaceae bacterium]
TKNIIILSISISKKIKNITGNANFQLYKHINKTIYTNYFTSSFFDIKYAFFLSSLSIDFVKEKN